MWTKKTLNRRAFLRGAGGIAIALPFLDIMRPTGAQAQIGTAPKRVIFLTSPNGTVSDLWFPDTSTIGSGDFPLSPILSPLERHKADLNIMLGIDNRVTRGGHFKGMCSLLTGRPAVEVGDNNSLGTGISVDQHIAQRLQARPETATPFSSLVLGTNRSSDRGTEVISYAGATTPVPKTHGAKNMFDEIFVGGDGATGERLRQMKRSILDEVRGDFDALNRRLGREDQVRLDMHLEAIREVERRIGAVSDRGIGDFTPGTTTNDSAALHEMLPQMFDVLELALATDMTRVVSFCIRAEGHASKWTFGWLGIGPEEDPYAHDTTDNAESTNHHSLSHHDSIERNRGYLETINAYYMSELAGVIDRLKAQQDLDGSSLFDNTLIVYGSPIARGNHKGNDMPFLLAGNAGGAIRTGQYLNLRTDGSTDFGVPDQELPQTIHGWGQRDSHYRGISHNDLLLTVLHAMGFDDEEVFGSPDHCSGVIDQLLA